MRFASSRANEELGGLGWRGVDCFLRRPSSCAHRDATKNGGYFIVPKTTYQLCQNPVDSNGVCNQGPCTQIACAGPTGDVDPLASDYLKQAKAFATQYTSNTNWEDSSWNAGVGTTSGGGTGKDVTGRPMWGNPVSADTAKSTTGRTDDDLMVVGDFGYDDKGAVFLMRRQPASDYMKYMDRCALQAACGHVVGCKFFPS